MVKNYIRALFTIRPEQNKKLKSVSKKEKISKSAVVRKAIDLLPETK